MQIKEQQIKGVYTVDLGAHEDHRGYFMRTYDEQIFAEHGLPTTWAQENESYSRNCNTLRGIHFQTSPHEEGKLVRAGQGEILMMYLDLRHGSETFGQWEIYILNAQKRNMLFVPKGFGLGMRTLCDDCTLLYKMDYHYVPESQGTIFWNDASLNIDWGHQSEDELTLSEKDQQAQTFEEFCSSTGSLCVGN